MLPFPQKLFLVAEMCIFSEFWRFLAVQKLSTAPIRKFVWFVESCVSSWIFRFSPVWSDLKKVVWINRCNASILFIEKCLNFVTLCWPTPDIYIYKTVVSVCLSATYRPHAFPGAAPGHWRQSGVRAGQSRLTPAPRHVGAQRSVDAR